MGAESLVACLAAALLCRAARRAWAPVMPPPLPPEPPPVPVASHREPVDLSACEVGTEFAHRRFFPPVTTPRPRETVCGDCSLTVGESHCINDGDPTDCLCRRCGVLRMRAPEPGRN